MAARASWSDFRAFLNDLKYTQWPLYYYFFTLGTPVHLLIRAIILTCGNSAQHKFMQVQDRVSALVYTENRSELPGIFKHNSVKVYTFTQNGAKMQTHAVRDHFAGRNILPMRKFRLAFADRKSMLTQISLYNWSEERSVSASTKHQTLR